MTQKIRAEDGDIVVLEARGYSLVANLIGVIDGSQFRRISYSHAGIVCRPTPGSDPSLISARHEKGIIVEPLRRLNKHRRVLILRHNGGERIAKTVHKYLPPPLTTFSMDQLKLSATAAILRGSRRIDWPFEPSFGRSSDWWNAWDAVHHASRRIAGPVNCCCWPQFPVQTVDSWYCASFVDHVFRAEGSCLGITEPALDRVKPLTNRAIDHFVALINAEVDPERLVALFRDDEAGDETDDVDDDDDDDDDADDTDEVDDPYRAAYGLVAGLDPPRDRIGLSAGIATSHDASGPLEGFGERLVDELVTSPRLAPQLSPLLRQEFADALQTVFDYCTVTTAGVLQGPPAPRPGEPMWPPFMSVRALIQRFASPIPVRRGQIT